MALPASHVRVTLTVNGTTTTTADVPARTSLADLLREKIGLTGTHLGCEHGVCGACTVLLDGRPVRSCITLAASCQDRSVVTVEGLTGAHADQIRQAFSRHHALQCGFCTPGMLITCMDIIGRNPDADEDEIRAELAGNICRCTGYAGIVEAVRAASGTIARAGAVNAGRLGATGLTFPP